MQFGWKSESQVLGELFFCKNKNIKIIIIGSIFKRFVMNQDSYLKQCIEAKFSFVYC